MPRYTIKSVQQMMGDDGQPKTDNYGNLSFKVWVQDGPEGITDFFRNVKPGHEPKAGDTLDGTLTRETSKAGNQYWKFTADRPAFQGGFGGGAPARRDDPEVQDQIIRQNALTNAVAYCSAKDSAKMTVDAVLDTAARFARFSKTGSVHATAMDLLNTPPEDFSDEIDMS